jgi:DNA-directed RNA polymerase sigma subunit (sigma70/sigma32)
MPKISKKTLRQFYALDMWLGHVYGHEMHFDTLLMNEGLSQIEIEEIMGWHLSEFLQEVMNLLSAYPDLVSPHHNIPMMLYYGLMNGRPQSFEAIGQSLSVSAQRIRQLLKQRMRWYRDTRRQALFQKDVAAIAWRLLDNESS